MCDEPEGDMKDHFGEGVREKVGYKDSPHPILDTLCDGEEGRRDLKTNVHIVSRNPLGGFASPLLRCVKYFEVF